MALNFYKSIVKADITLKVRDAIQLVPFSAAGDADFYGMAEAAVSEFERWIGVEL